MLTDVTSPGDHTLAGWLAAKRNPLTGMRRLPIDEYASLALLAAGGLVTHAPLLATWRNAARGCFFTEFTATGAATLRWLQTRYLPSDELLFLIILHDRTVGHVGLGGFGIQGGCAEIGRVLLSPDARGRGLMLKALETLIVAMGPALALERLWLEVFADNPHALATYRAAGFEVASRRTFACSRAEGMTCWAPVVMGGPPWGRLREVLRLERHLPLRAYHPRCILPGEVSSEPRWAGGPARLSDAVRRTVPPNGCHQT
jgi:RimJ/RimL family protein N-acetyltransferase